MRWSSLAGTCVLFAACHVLVACGDDDDNIGGGTAGGGAGGTSTAGTGGKASAGSQNQAGTEAKAGTAGTGGTFGTGGTMAEGGAAEGGATTAGTAGSGGTGVTPACTVDKDCDDFNACTDDKCTDGVCEHTNNTATCDDGNGCTADDKCASGKCAGTNTTDACDDLSSCTSGDKCADGACVGTNDAVMCPACATADNLIQNCDFSMGTDHYQQSFDDGSAGTQQVVNGRLVVDITAGGANLWSIQPRQEGLSIKQGMKYKLHFLAGASVDRKMFIAITQNHAGYEVYSDNGYTIDLTQQMKPFDFTFTVTKADDANMKLEIRLGTVDWNAAANSVYFDDFSLVPLKCADATACDDGNACTTDTCDADGICHNANNTGDCAPGDVDTDPCTDDVCDAGKCTHPAGADAVPCAADADDCTVDACLDGKCEHTFSKDLCPACTLDVHCDDKEACTDDKCNGGVCENTPITAACDDNNACTTGDACDAGKCVPGTPNTDACDDSKICTIQTMCADSACGGGLNFCDDCTVAGNLITNCNFTTDTTGWLEGFYAGAGGTQTMENGMLAITTTAAGPGNWAVQPRQAGIDLVKGQTYIVAFKAKATIARNFQLSLTQDADPYAQYAGVHDIALTTELQQYTFTFTMDADPPAQKVKFEMDLGSDANNPSVPNTVYIDDVTVRPTP